MFYLYSWFHPENALERSEKTLPSPRHHKSINNSNTHIRKLSVLKKRKNWYCFTQLTRELATNLNSSCAWFTNRRLQTGNWMTDRNWRTSKRSLIKVTSSAIYLVPILLVKVAQDPTSSPGSSRFPIWRRQERRPWHTAEITWLICPRRVEIYSKWRPS